MNVLITGGASGLGLATAEAVEKEGWRALVVDVREPDQRFDHVTADLADRGQAERAVRELAERAGGLDAVVTAAGIDACGRLEDVPADDWERVIQVNHLGTAAVVRAALPYLKRSRGKVVTCALLIPGGMRTSFFDGRPDQYEPGPEAGLNDPADVAQTVVFALRQPADCEVRELVVRPSTETSWP
ncbi:short-chain dehydrogenase [Nonomuraea sp. WAC 01424]|uniref:SDR family oxidoreductase n=1 Tax=Nonomuraea sp. WAC 01424 TaxID=2203200 RepID=UPI000F782587|nr:SDR family oxidoreductase [Nonomuraea sp. WAC 01424]RSN02581.1 short-chain dehydrogenase [Nonomuraea sp. WAC 01424]